MDFDDVESVALDVFGGADTVTVITNGTGDADTIRARRSGNLPVVRGVGAETRVTGGAELGLDTLRIQTLGGNDVVEVGDIWDLITPVVDLGADE